MDFDLEAYLSLGTGMASVMGVRVRALRLIAVLCASALSGAVVSFAGLLGFVGLIVPHMARALVGNHTRHLLAASALLGGAVTVTADLLGRVLLSPTEIPVGIMMALVGAPFFLFFGIHPPEFLALLSWPLNQREEAGRSPSSTVKYRKGSGDTPSSL